MRRAVCLCAFLALAMIPSEAAAPMRIRVSPVQAFAPATVSVQIGVDRSVANGAVEVVADSEDFYRSSQVQIDGDRGPATVRVEFKDVPRGVYTISAVLKDRSGQQRALVQREVNIYGGLTSK